jgi:hypothetical protein
MKKLIILLMVGSLFSSEIVIDKGINITKKSKVLIYTNLF